MLIRLRSFVREYLSFLSVHHSAIQHKKETRMYSSKTFFTYFFLATTLITLNSAFASKVIAYIDPDCTNHSDGKIIEEKTFIGKLDAFVWGDYLHGEFVDSNGKSLSLFIETRDVSCFLALHKGENLTIKYNRICRYFPDGAGIYPAENIIQINAGKENFKTWRTKFEQSQNRDLCEKLKQKYTRKP